MKAEIESTIKPIQLLVDTRGVQEALGVGRPAAEKIGKDAQACVRIGRLVRWDLNKIKKYIEAISE